MKNRPGVTDEKGIIAWFAHNPVASNLLMWILVAGGLLALPWWLAGEPTILVNGQAQTVASGASSFHEIRRNWSDDTLHIQLPKQLTACPVPDDPERVAFMDGPVVLAGLCDEERTLNGDPGDPTTILAPACEREWGVWLDDYRTVDQPSRIDFRPIHRVVDEPYTLYFPVRR